MQQNTHSWFLRAALAGAVTAGVTAGIAVRSAEAQTAAANAYQRATTREADARKSEKPAIATLRSVAASYENVVRRYPRSGYADNALWQAATLHDLAFEVGGQTRDQTKARSLYDWLKREYPRSSLAKQAATRLAAPRTNAAAAVANASVVPAAVPPPAPAPTVPPQAPIPAAAPVALTPLATPTLLAASAPAPVAAAAAAPVAPAPRLAAPAPVPRPMPSASTRKPATPAAALATTNPPLPNLILPAAVTLTSINVTPLPKGDRLTFELSRESTFTAVRLPRSNFVTFTLPNVGLSAAALSAVSSLKGALVQSVRLTPKNGGTEIEVRMVGQPRHSTFPLYGPYRLVVDVEGDAAIAREASPVSVPVAAVPTNPGGATAVAELAASTPQPAVALPAAPPADMVSARPVMPSSTTTGGYSLARQLGLGVSRIVIDPGHGGHDPGAQANGVLEAELVLDVALRLERLLQAQPGFEVVLTRRTNEFIALEARTAFANRESADLFLSIHANASPQSDTRGVETYFLNFSSNAHAEGVAARENAASSQSMRLLPSLVKAITLNNKRAESREFANIVQAALVKQMKTQNKNVKDLGVKQAPFVVLIGAEMPSVLAEISFITNRADASLLKQQAYRQRVAQALADGVLRYQGSLKKFTDVATTKAAN